MMCGPWFKTKQFHIRTHFGAVLRALWAKGSPKQGAPYQSLDHRYFGPLYYMYLVLHITCYVLQ